MTRQRLAWLLWAALAGALFLVASFSNTPAAIVGAFAFLYFVNRFLG